MRSLQLKKNVLSQQPNQHLYCFLDDLALLSGVRHNLKAVLICSSLPDKDAEHSFHTDCDTPPIVLFSLRESGSESGHLRSPSRLPPGCL